MHHQVAQLFAFALIIVAVGVVHRHGLAIARILEERHSDAYRTLDSPRPSYLNPISNARFDRFILKRGYAGLADPKLEAKCEAHRHYMLALIVVLPVAVLGLWLLR